MVCFAVEDRGVPQNPQIRVQGRGVEIKDRRTFISWRVFWMTMLNRSAPTAPPNVALTKTEIELLNHLVKDKAKPQHDEKHSPTT
jgi:hypothetical protein